jgi:hypothetical protein
VLSDSVELERSGTSKQSNLVLARSSGQNSKAFTMATSESRREHPSEDYIASKSGRDTFDLVVFYCCPLSWMLERRLPTPVG